MLIQKSGDINLNPVKIGMDYEAISDNTKLLTNKHSFIKQSRNGQGSFKTISDWIVIDTDTKAKTTPYLKVIAENKNFDLINVTNGQGGFFLTTWIQSENLYDKRVQVLDENYNPIRVSLKGKPFLGPCENEKPTISAGKSELSMFTGGVIKFKDFPSGKVPLTYLIDILSGAEITLANVNHFYQSSVKGTYLLKCETSKKGPLTRKDGNGGQILRTGFSYGSLCTFKDSKFTTFNQIDGYDIVIPTEFPTDKIIDWCLLKKETATGEILRGLYNVSSGAKVFMDNDSFDTSKRISFFEFDEDTGNLFLSYYKDGEKHYGLMNKDGKIIFNSNDKRYENVLRYYTDMLNGYTLLGGDESKLISPDGKIKKIDKVFCNIKSANHLSLISASDNLVLIGFKDDYCFKMKNCAVFDKDLNYQGLFFDIIGDANKKIFRNLLSAGPEVDLNNVEILNFTKVLGDGSNKNTLLLKSMKGNSAVMMKLDDIFDKVNFGVKNNTGIYELNGKKYFKTEFIGQDEKSIKSKIISEALTSEDLSNKDFEVLSVSDKTISIGGKTLNKSILKLK